MDRVSIECSRAEVAQLLAYLNARDQGNDSGWYYAPKKTFERRHANLKKILSEAVLRKPMGPLTECDMHEDESY